MKILCNWCNNEKEKTEYNKSSLGNFGQGKRIYCIDCKSKYQKEIDNYTDQQVLNKKFSDKHFALKNGNPEAFKKYLLISNYKQHKYMIEIDKESYELSLELKKEAAILKDKRHTEKRKIRRKTDPEFKNHLSKLSKERYLKNGESEKRKQQKKEWSAKNLQINKDKVYEKSNQYRRTNKNYKEKRKTWQSKYRIKKYGFETIEEYENHILNKKLEAQLKKDNIKKQKEEKRKQREIDKQYRIENAEKIKAEYIENRKHKFKEKRKTDMQYKLMDNLRARTRKILKIQSAKKTTNMAKLIGCSGKELSERFMSMGYDSNTCHIDHIIPMSLFDLTIPQHQYIACHYLNLQPLTAFDNMSKCDTLIEQWQDKIKEICNHLSIDDVAIIEHINQYK